MNLTLQFIENFAGIADFGKDGSVNCSTIGPGCGMPLNAVVGPVPSLNHLGGHASWTSTAYTITTGHTGSLRALTAITDVGFRTENGALRDTWVVGFRFKTSSFASAVQVVGYRSSSVRLDVTTGGKWRLYFGGSGAGGGTAIATSNESVVAGTWYHVEIATYHDGSASVGAGTGAMRVKVDGVALTWTSILAGYAASGESLTGATGLQIDGPTWTGSTVTLGEPYGFADDAGGYADDDSHVSSTRLPRCTSMLPVSQGSYSSFARYSGATSSTVVLQGAGDSTNYQYIDDTPSNDTPLTHLRSANTNDRDSWIMGPLDPAAGEILGVVTSICVAGFAGLVESSHELHIGGVAYNISTVQPYTDGDFEWVNASASYEFNARHWPNNPAGRGWEAADLATLELGWKATSGIDSLVSYARLLVLWLEPLAVEAPDGEEIGPECQPCDSSKAARFLDSFLEYDGENDSDEALTLNLAPGADWTTVGLSHTLVTDGTDQFAAGDVGKAYRLGDPHGDSVILDVTAFASADSITVTNRTPVPLSLRATPTATWALMVDSVAGLDHLEGEEVYSIQDGLPGGPYTVTSGEVELDDHYAVVAVGLRITAEIETLDFEVPGAARADGHRQKQINQVSIHVDKSRSFYIGDPDNEGSVMPISMLGIDGHEDLADALVSRKGTFTIPARADGLGRVFIRHTDPLPLTILSITPKTDSVGKTSS